MTHIIRFCLFTLLGFSRHVRNNFTLFVGLNVLNSVREHFVDLVTRRFRLFAEKGQYTSHVHLIIYL